MMITKRKLFTLLIALAVQLYPFPCVAKDTVISNDSMHVETSKVIHVDGDISMSTAVNFSLELTAVDSIPGNLVVLVNSNGGMVDAGMIMINMINEQQAKGVKVICINTGAASSMAFNLMARCDVRYAVKNAQTMFHRVFIILRADRSGFITLTAKALKRYLSILKEDNDRFDTFNQMALGISKEDYNRMADIGATLNMKTMMQTKFYSGIVDIK